MAKSILILLFILFSSQLFSQNSNNRKKNKSMPVIPARVLMVHSLTEIRVTIHNPKLGIEGEFFDVKLIGIEEDPFMDLSSVSKAKAYMEHLLLKKQVFLKLKVYQGIIRLPNGRLRRRKSLYGYVYLNRQKTINEVLIEKGYVKVDEETKFTRYFKFKRLEYYAQKQRKGLWAVHNFNPYDAGLY